MPQTQPLVNLRSPSMPRYAVLDGWRGISILCVLMAHMLPLGPKRFHLNEAMGELGMALFFTLSGFLITATLIYRPGVLEFLIRRLCRILPLVWLFILVALALNHSALRAYPAHLLFYANLPPFWLTPLTGHLWSICVEMHFYIAVALISLIFRQRGLLVLPALCIAVTAFRVYVGAQVSIVTYCRVDEILVGCCLALAYEGKLGSRIRLFLGLVNPLALACLLIISCFEAGGAANYLRPYFAAALVGTTLFAAGRRSSRWLANSKQLRYVAEISYAIYVIHPLTMSGWLGTGDAAVRYAKRIISFVLTFGVAHLSTNYYEARWITFGKRLCRKLNRNSAGDSTKKTDPFFINSGGRIEQSGVPL